MPRPSFQFRLSTLLWITLAVACWFGGMLAGDIRARRGIQIYQESPDDGIFVTEYADGRMMATEEDRAGNRTTLEMKIKGDTWSAKMPSGAVVRHRKGMDGQLRETGVSGLPYTGPSNDGPAPFEDIEPDQQSRDNAARWAQSLRENWPDEDAPNRASAPKRPPTD